ncbi:MAG TPA: glycosyltransferase, partial [Thermococcus sp.]|nr:glycosyltransferase [Thermococcus sp.]
MISIIIPTYNERENLEELFERVSRALEDRDFEIIIV